MKLEIRKAEEKDLLSIFSFRSTYIDMSYEEFIHRAKSNNGLWFVVYDKSKLIGYCLGLKSNNDSSYISIDEIVTNVSKSPKYKRKGIGSQLIKEFEKQVWEQGYKTIGLGCTDNFKVENFYLKNEYTPIEVVVKRNGIDLERIKISEYKSGKEIQAELRSKYKAKGVYFVFEKYNNVSTF
jgi:GNAT superfamily N-acetyltransferase